MSSIVAPRLPHVECPRCRRAVALQHDGELTCGACRLAFTVRTFAPPMRRAEKAQEAGIGPGASAVCGNHPRNVAAQSCSRCGMFVCSLCVIETDEMALCPGCYDRLSAEGALASTRTKFRDMTGLATTSVAVGILMWPIMPLTGPFAVGYAIKALRQRRELGDLYSPLHVWIVLLLGVAETVGGIALVAVMIGAMADA